MMYFLSLLYLFINTVHSTTISNQVYPIVRQPIGDYEFVSLQPNAFTQYQNAENTGLLAHGHLAGQALLTLETNDIVTLDEQDYVVVEILKYQALEDGFLDLSSNKTISESDLFKFIYTGNENLVFQTCIIKDDNLTWGRLFVIAVPMVDLEMR